MRASSKELRVLAGQAYQRAQRAGSRQEQLRLLKRAKRLAKEAEAG